MDFEKLECAAFKAWPAIEEVDWQGLRLRFANGFTKRANSANLVKRVNDDYTQLTDRIEQFFYRRAQPSVIRIPSYTDSEGFDNYLAAKGYRKDSLSQVLSCHLPVKKFSQLSVTGNNDVAIIEKTAAQWLHSYCEISANGTAGFAEHLAILESIDSDVIFAVLQVEGREVACGLGVSDGELLGIFDVCTCQQERGKGYAAELLQGVFEWALERGVQYSYLQVVANNSAAINLYHKLGYRLSYQYWYRIKDSN